MQQFLIEHARSLQQNPPRKLAKDVNISHSTLWRFCKNPFNIKVKTLLELMANGLIPDLSENRVSDELLERAIEAMGEYAVSGNECDDLIGELGKILVRRRSNAKTKKY